METNNKIIISIFTLLLFMSFLYMFMPKYEAITFQELGNPNYSGGTEAITANYLKALKFNFVSATSTTFDVTYGKITVTVSSGTHNAKMVILNSSKYILYISNPTSTTSTVTQRMFYFSGTPVLNNGTDYYLGIITDYASTWYGASAPTYDSARLTDTTNDYTTPTDPTDASSSGTAGIQICIGASWNTAPTPTPSPTPIPVTYSYEIAPTPNFTVYNYVTSPHINQSQNYVYTGTLSSYFTPYGSATYSVYNTSILTGSLNNNTIRDSLISELGLTGAESLTLNTSGTFSLNGYGTFNFNILLEYQYNSICKYQGFKVNGTIPSTGEIFTSYMIIEASEPNTNSIISVYLNGGTLTNYLLDTQLNYNQIAYNTQYNASGFIYLNGIPYTDNDSIVVQSTVISINAISAKNLPFGNNLNLVAINGQFTFLITAQIYNAVPSYQGIKITQPTLGIETTYWIEYIGLGTTVFPTPYPTSSSSVINPTSTSSVDITQYTVLFFLVFVPPLLLAAMCYQTTQKEILKVSPVIGFFLGLCIMVPIGYLTPYNGAPLLPLWMLFIFVGGLIISGVLIVKGMLRDVVSG